MGNGYDMALMDFLQNMQNGGLVGNYLNNLQNSMNEVISRPKPGQLCNSRCEINDSRCEACLAEQQQVLDAMGEAQKLEQAINNLNNNPAAAAVPENKPTKCSLCGAPFEQGLKACPYCDTPYPSDALSSFSAGDLPVNKIEQDNLMLEKVASAWALYAALYKKQVQNNLESTKAKVPSFLGGVMGTFNSKLSEMMDMNAAEIRQCANENNVSYYEYVIGVMQERYKSAKVVMLEKQNEMIKEQQRRNQEYFDRNREIEQWRQDRLRQTQEERNAIMMRRASSTTYGYNGGSGISSSDRQCCGSCTHYMAGANECAVNSWNPKSASDYCGKYHSR